MVYFIHKYWILTTAFFNLYHTSQLCIFNLLILPLKWGIYISASLFHQKIQLFYLDHVVFNVGHECLYDVFIVSKRSSVFVWPLHSDIRVSLSMATPSSSPTPHHVTWIDTDGRKEDWFWSLAVSEDTLSLSCSPELSPLSRLWLPSTKLLIYKKTLS